MVFKMKAHLVNKIVLNMVDQVIHHMLIDFRLVIKPPKIEPNVIHLQILRLAQNLFTIFFMNNSKRMFNIFFYEK